MHNATSSDPVSNTQPPSKPNYDLRTLPNRNFQYWRPPNTKNKGHHSSNIPSFIPLPTDTPLMEKNTNVHSTEDHIRSREHKIPLINTLEEDFDLNLDTLFNPVPPLQPIMAAAPTVQSFIPLPSTFYGKADENPKIHVHKFQIYAQLLGIQDDLEQIKTHFGQFLSGRAFLWYSTNKDDIAIVTTDGF